MTGNYPVRKWDLCYITTGKQQEITMGPEMGPKVRKWDPVVFPVVFLL